jgi:predicted peptidase
MRIRTSLAFLVLLLCVTNADSAAQVRQETGFLDRSVTLGGLVFRYQVYVPSDYTPTRHWPVLMHLHGAGERGTDGLLQTQGGVGLAIRQNLSRYPAIVVFPQAPKDSLWVGVPAKAAMMALDEAMKEFQADSDRVYLTGLSMGGNGTWYLAYRNPGKFAAVAPICGWVAPFNPRFKSFETVVPPDSGSAFQALARQLRRVPIWIFHGEEDPAVPVDQSRQAAEALRGVSTVVQYTELPGVGHNSWDAAYGSAKFTTWLFSQKRRP